MTRTNYRTSVKATDAELDAFMDARYGKPITRKEADLQIAAVFLTTAHRWKEKGKRLQEIRSIYKGLCEEPGLVEELRKRKLLLGPLRAP